MNAADWFRTFCTACLTGAVSLYLFMAYEKKHSTMWAVAGSVCALSLLTLLASVVGVIWTLGR